MYDVICESMKSSERGAYCVQNVFSALDEMNRHFFPTYLRELAQCAVMKLYAYR